MLSGEIVVFILCNNFLTYFYKKMSKRFYLFIIQQNETLIAIKAPHGTTLEVPDPDEVRRWEFKILKRQYTQGYFSQFILYIRLLIIHKGDIG